MNALCIGSFGIICLLLAEQLQAEQPPNPFLSSKASVAGSPEVTTDSDGNIVGVCYLAQNQKRRSPYPTTSQIEALTTFPKLKRLVITTSGSHDGIFPALGRLKGLESLELPFGQFSSESVQHLLTLDELMILDMTGTSLSDDGLKKIVESMPKLREIHIGNTSVSDVGLQHLTQLKFLEVLVIGDGNGDEEKVALITDAGALQLAKISTLKHLHISYCSITLQGFGELADSLVDCRISSHYKHPRSEESIIQIPSDKNPCRQNVDTHNVSGVSVEPSTPANRDTHPSRLESVPAP